MKKHWSEYLGAALFLLLIWFLAARLVALPIVPSPVEVMTRLEIVCGEIAWHAAYSLRRIFCGLGLAVALGYPLGLIMGYFPKAGRYLSPVVYLTYPIPKIALLPILMLLAGVGETAKVIMIFLIIFFQVVIAVRDAVRDIKPEYLYPLYTLGANLTDICREVLLPASLPHFLTAVRVAMATAISVLFFTETFGTDYGMGYFIMDAWLRVNYLDMYAGIIVLSVLGLLLFAALDRAESVLCRWRQVGGLREEKL